MAFCRVYRGGVDPDTDLGEDPGQAQRDVGTQIAGTTRHVQLTPAGKQLDEEAQSVLASVAAATRRVHAGRGVERLVVGCPPGWSVSAAVRAFNRRSRASSSSPGSVARYAYSDKVHDN
jgi:DNA-binding transcriptional LysR family regulator